MTTIAVAGATGTVGRYVVTAARAAGHTVVPLSRSAGIDVVTGEGLEAALRGVDAVVDVLNVGTGSAARATAFFEATTTALLDAEQTNGVGHHVLLSIVGIDAAPGGYYAGKLHQERLVRAGGTPWTIQRATQFHEFAAQVLAAASVGRLSAVPVARVRPVAAAEVGARLAELAGAAPQNGAADLRGPREERLVEMARRLISARGQRRTVVPVPLPGRVGRAMRSGALCGSSTAVQGQATFEDWLDQNVPNAHTEGESA